jgi:hypothetical protein
MLEVEKVNQGSVSVAITASREKGEIVYRVECSSDLADEEFEYYPQLNSQWFMQVEKRQL